MLENKLKKLVIKDRSQEHRIQIIHHRCEPKAAKGRSLWSPASQLKSWACVGGCIVTLFADTVRNHKRNKSREGGSEIEREIRTSLNSVSTSIKFKGT